MHESDNPLYKDIPLKPTRKIIARNMQASLQNMAQLTLNRSFDGRRLLAARALCKASPDADIQKITLNDMILFSVSRVLPNHPMLNSHYMGDFIRVFKLSILVLPLIRLAVCWFRTFSRRTA